MGDKVGECCCGFVAGGVGDCDQMECFGGIRGEVDWGFWWCVCNDVAVEEGGELGCCIYDAVEEENGGE